MGMYYKARAVYLEEYIYYMYKHQLYAPWKTGGRNYEHPGQDQINSKSHRGFTYS